MAATDRFVMPFTQWVDGNSRMLAGGKLYFYLTGTDTPQDTYANATLETENANPVVADSNGVWPDIFLSPFVAYKVILKASDDNEIDSADPVTAPGFQSSYLRPEMFGGSPDTAGQPDTHPDQRAALVACFAAADTLQVPVVLSGGTWPIDSALPNPVTNHFLDLRTEAGCQIYARFNRTSGQPILGFTTHGVNHSGDLAIQGKAGTSGGIQIAHVAPSTGPNVGIIRWGTLFLGGASSFDHSFLVDGRANETVALGVRDGTIERMVAFYPVAFKGARLFNVASIACVNVDLGGSEDVYTDGVKIFGEIGGNVNFGTQIVNPSAPPATIPSPTDGHARRCDIFARILGNITNSSKSLWCYVHQEPAGVVETNWDGLLEDEYGNDSYSGVIPLMGLVRKHWVSENGDFGYTHFSDGRLIKFGRSTTNGSGTVTVHIDNDGPADAPDFAGVELPVYITNATDNVAPVITSRQYTVSTTWVTAATFRAEARIHIAAVYDSASVQPISLSFQWTIKGRAA